MTLLKSLLLISALTLATLVFSMLYVKALLWSTRRSGAGRVILPYILYLGISAWIVLLIVTVISQNVFGLNDSEGILAELGRILTLLVTLAPLSYLFVRRRELELAGFMFKRK